MKMSSPIMLATDDADLRDRVAVAATGVAEVTVVSAASADLLQALVEAKPALLLVDFNTRTPLATLVGLVRRADPSLQTVAVGDSRNADAVLGAIRSGAADFLDRAEPRDVMRAQILRHLRAGAEAQRAAPGSFELVLAAQPGCGDSLLALNLAVLKAAPGGEMLLIDCTLPTSEAAAALDIRTPYTIQDAVNDVHRLDRTLVSSTLARDPDTGLMVLPLATWEAPDVDTVAPEALARLVIAVRPLFRDTIMALGGIRSPGLLLEFMQAATRIYFVCPQKLTAVADGQQLLDRIRPGPEVLQRTVLVVEEHDPRISLTEEQMRITLGLSNSFCMPRCRVDLLNSLNLGRPLVSSQPKGAYAQALARLTGVEPRAATPLAARLLGEALAKVRAPKLVAGGAR